MQSDPVTLINDKKESPNNKRDSSQKRQSDPVSKVHYDNNESPNSKRDSS